MTEPGRVLALTKDELAVVRRVLAASGDEWKIAEAFGRRRLSMESDIASRRGL
jgi:hypothetical protein